MKRDDEKCFGDKGVLKGDTKNVFPIFRIRGDRQLTLKVETASFAEKVQNLQHSM
jgi:hypothetical protein